MPSTRVTCSLAAAFAVCTNKWENDGSLLFVVVCRQVVVGNSRGRVALVDVRRKGMVHAFKGVAGSIRAVCCHPTLPLVASCGLDRFLRVHDLNTRLLQTKVGGQMDGLGEVHGEQSAHRRTKPLASGLLMKSE